MNRSDRQRFEMRFYRGLTSTAPERAASSSEEWQMRACTTCGNDHLLKNAGDECFKCKVRRDPPPMVYLSVVAEGEDSKNPQRIADGTAQYNIGLRGIDTVVGKNPDGTPKLSYRPITNNEVATARARREYAKRNGQTPLETSKRAIGGR